VRAAKQNTRRPGITQALVEVNVSADRPEVALILDQSGSEAALGEVARSPRPLGVPVGVTGDEVLHASRQVGLRHTEEEVEVVGHNESLIVPTFLRFCSRLA